MKYFCLNVKIYLLLIFALSILPFQFSFAEENQEKNILIIITGYPDFPWVKSFKSGIESVQKKEKTKSTSNLYFEYLDANRFPKLNHRSIWSDFLATKYRSLKIEAVILNAPVALNLIKNEGRHIFGDIPYIIVTSSPFNLGSLQYTATIQNRANVSDTIKLALKLHPYTKQIVFLGDTSFPSQKRLHFFRLAVKTLAADINIVVKTSIDLESLQKYVSKLSSNTLVFCASIFQDKNRTQYIPKNVIKDLAQNTSAPIYVF